MGMFDKSRRAQEQGFVSPLEANLRQSDREMLEEQKKRLKELPEDEQKAWVPTGDIETQRKVDEEERPSE